MKKGLMIVGFILLMSSFVFSAECGDYICDVDETFEGCPTDCVSAEDMIPEGSFCGDFICAPDEDEFSCPIDCDMGELTVDPEILAELEAPISPAVPIEDPTVMANQTDPAAMTDPAMMANPADPTAMPDPTFTEEFLPETVPMEEGASGLTETEKEIPLTFIIIGVFILITILIVLFILFKGRKNKFDNNFNSQIDVEPTTHIENLSKVGYEKSI